MLVGGHAAAGQPAAMKPRIYVETSVVSYLTARPSTDAINAARQGYARQLWLAGDRYDLLVSALVLDEAGNGDAEAAQRRVAALQGIPLLPLDDGTVTLAEALIRDGTMPSKAYADAMHIDCAACARMDVIASWNFRHIAGLWARQRIRDALVPAGHVAPLIATPRNSTRPAPAPLSKRTLGSAAGRASPRARRAGAGHVHWSAPASRVPGAACAAPRAVLRRRR